MNDPDVLGTAARERWAYSDADLHAVIRSLWDAYTGEESVVVDLPPQLLRAALVTLADGAERMVEDFWGRGHAA